MVEALRPLAMVLTLSTLLITLLVLSTLFSDDVPAAGHMIWNLMCGALGGWVLRSVQELR